MTIFFSKGTRLRIPLGRQSPILFGGSLALAMRAPLYLLISMIHHRLGITMVTSRRYFLAADPRIECVIAPFDFGIFTHNKSPKFLSKFCYGFCCSRILYSVRFGANSPEYFRTERTMSPQATVSRRRLRKLEMLLALKKPCDPQRLARRQPVFVVCSIFT